ncbi:heat shock 70 kDa protein 12A-like isoform X1 [Stylophora pistillata]|uniref:heat shock 70 kDa protein 12A-like isoform X1 n=1 Tax=Stylophora pistillata TaxID=50429 RepID=UPI000C03EDB6|nr:heat shock 70 kDa protein 12A-like isoform X1 [Stylophora pistillata]
MASSSGNGTHHEESYLATIGIDFGTTFSGFAFSFNKDEGKDAIFLNRDWVNDQGHRTSKTPTCLLLKPDLSFDSFGYTAMERYSGLKSMYEEKEFFFFQHFKMELHNEETIDLQATIPDARYKRVQAKKVFAHAIRFLGDEAINFIRQETGDQSFKVEDVLWVLTVPAIWSPRAKQLMREAAYEAGTVCRDHPEQLVIALEPEAAAIFCTERKMDAILSEKLDVSVDGLLSQLNAQYMVVDIGGGTLDVTVHEKQDDGRIREIHKVTGGPYGGNKVNHQFEGLLDELFGAEKLYEYRKLFPIDWLHLKNDFEEKKRGVRSQQKKETRIRLPYSFVSTINKFLPHSLARYGEGEIKLQRNEYLCLSPSVMIKQFEPVLEAMKDHLDVLLSKPELSKVKVMLLVGGFAESPILQQKIMEKFNCRCRVIVPRDAAKAVVQGAVMFGQLPDRISQRVMSTTYGCACCRDFIQGIHPNEKKFIADGVEKCRDLFACFVKEDEEVKLGQRIRQVFHPVYANQTEVPFGFYTSSNADAQFVTEPGLTKIGNLVVHSPVTRGGRDRDIEVSLYFGGTEITATALDVSSGNVKQTTLDFFPKS